jgi:transcriptional regulator with XRE-family HTH domain
MIAQRVVVNKRTASPMDFEIGRRIRALRSRQGMSQAELGNLIGVRFHQIQKYERGENRVPAGRLRRLAEVLKAPITSFYLESATESEETAASDVELAYLQTAGAVRLVRAFSRIRDRKARRILVDLVERLAEPEDAPPT